MPSNPLTGFLSAGGSAGAGSQIDAILDAVRHHLGMEIAFASRYAQGRRQFTHIRAGIPVPAAPGDSEPLDETFCHHILEGRLPELIRDAGEIPFALDIPITRALPVGAHLNVPLRLRDGTVYGSFCCLSRTADHSLTERDLGTLRAFAELAAVQIELELDGALSRNAAIERINDAIALGQPSMAFQPIHRLDSGLPVGVEALARFAGSDPRPPCDWFNEAAAVGLAADLELAAVRAAIQALPYIPAPAYMAVNVSPGVATSGALDRLLAPLPPGRVVLEITEHEETGDYAELRRALESVRGQVRIAVDDVGAGYSGLRHILDLQPDVLKLDMGLTRDVDTDPARRALIAAMVGFAAGIGCTIVAEGVETEGEFEVLRALGVDHGQGWFFSRALPPVAAQQYLLGAGRGRPARAARSQPASPDSAAA